MKKPLIVLTGPTAAGKTHLSIALAKAVNGEIISADSMQVYKYMDIGSAKIRPEEMQGVKHYLVDELLPEEEFHIVKFQQMAKAAMEEIYAKGKVPILVGGTGFYIQAITKDIDFTQADQEDGYRRELEQLAAEKGNDYLHTMLQEVDPVSAKEIHANNVKRVIRALEFYHQNQSPISAHNQEQKEHETPYNLAYFVLNVPRELLYKRIDDRIDEMLEEGLLEEVEQLKKRGCHRGMVSMQGLGYKEILAYLEGEYPLEEAVRVLKRDTRHFAKRQLTWFRREKETIWMNKDEFDYNEDLILERMVEICKDKKILDEQMKDKNIKYIRNKKIMKEMYAQLGISSEVYDFGHKIEESLKERFEKFDKTAEYNQMKVLLAMQKNKVSAECFGSSSGYGYDDIGRETLEKVYADTFHTEACLVRPQITCGTHALAIALFGNLRPGDELLAPAGKPYDTLEEVIGIRPSKGSLAEYGVTYRQVELLEDGTFDYDSIRKAINEKTRLVEIQRSKGYQTRPSFSVKQIGELIAFVKSIKPDVICMVDNCYGEFVDTIEPSDVGADMIVGSLIKNPGGGLAPIGGYIAGTKECVENASYRMTCPGLGSEVGATLGVNRSFFQGFFLAPMVTKGALKGAVFAANIYEKLGFPVIPDSTEERQDIIQAVSLGTPEGLIAFCKGIQAAAPVDSYVDPEPWDMPGYDSQVIMAAGAFVQGSSIELSADGPMKPPYAVYFQGGLTWEHAKLGVLMSLQKLVDKKLVTL